MRAHLVSCKFVQNLKHISHSTTQYKHQTYKEAKPPGAPLTIVVGHAQVERELLQLSVVREEVSHGGWNFQPIRFLLFLQSQNPMSQLLLFTTKCREGHL